MKRIEVKKGSIQRIGDLKSKAHQAESGLLGSYSICDKGKEHIYNFASEDLIIADIVSPDLSIFEISKAISCLYCTDLKAVGMMLALQKTLRCDNI